MTTFDASLRAIPQVCRDRALYLWPTLVTPPIAQFAHYLDPSTPLLTGHAAGVVFALVGLLVAFILWIPYHPQLDQKVLWSSAKY